MSVAVSFEQVSKAFGATRAVDDLTLAISPGELFFLLGPSGCGKTTLLRCLAGFCDPDAGRILLGGADITRVPAHLREIGMVFQSYALWPHLSVRANVAFGLEMRGLPRADIARRTEEALALVHMADRADHKPNQLSGGQQQRVALARALVIQPRCLLLDEPLSNLDAKLRLEMRQEIRRICKQAGLTAIYVTHDQKEALSIADRLAVLRNGRVQQVGTPQEVYRQPRSAFVAGFIGETNLCAGRVAAAGRDSLRIALPFGEVVSLSAPAGWPAAGADVTVSIRPEGIRFDDPPAGAPNVFNGHVHHTHYLGEMAQHQVTVRAGAEETTLKAFEMDPRFVARDRPESARFWIPPQQVVTLGREPC